MGSGFGITEEDVYGVLLSHGVPGASFDMADEVFGELDADQVERVALKASVDLDEQTAAACEEIWRQCESSPSLQAYFAQIRADSLAQTLPNAGSKPNKGPRF